MTAECRSQAGKKERGKPQPPSWAEPHVVLVLRAAVQLWSEPLPLDSPFQGTLPTEGVWTAFLVLANLP